MVTAPDVVVVPFVYTCGKKANPKRVEYDPGAFQTVFSLPSAAAFTDTKDGAQYSSFLCDGTEHTTDVVLTGEEDSFGFQRGNVEIGLVLADDESSAEPTFEHAIVGYDQLHDRRVPVSITANAIPEPATARGNVTVKGKVLRGGRPYSGKAADLYLQSRAGDPAVMVGRAVVDGKGNSKATVRFSGPGTYFWTTKSTTKTQAGSSLGDYVAAG